MLNKLNKRKEGFTIVEVLIVLAIAGVIMLVVFLAVPALQRNSRNTQRRADAAHMAGLINEYSANHGGALPTDTIVNTNYGTEKFAIMNAPAAGGFLTVANPGTNGGSGTIAELQVHPGTVCSATNLPTTAGASARSFSIHYKVETSGVGTEDACLNG
jgi:prepilin-type N-terminal cleavage/methylation domain-containing protein